MEYKKYTKCDFCQYRAGGRCTVKPDSFYCRDAQNEFYQWLKERKQGRK